MKWKSVSTASLAALLAGLVVGSLLGGGNGTGLLIDIFEITARIWILCLLLLAIPLISVSLFKGVLSIAKKGWLGRMQFYGWTIHVGFLVACTALSILVSHFLLNFTQAELLTIKLDQSGEPGSGLISILETLRPFISNLIIPVILISFVLSLPVLYLPNKSKIRLKGFMEKRSKVLFKWLRRLFIFLPLAVFSLALTVGSASSGELMRTGIFYILGVCTVLLAAVSLIYLLVFLFARNEFKGFAHSILPSQLFALSTSSSLASTPSILDSMEKLAVPTSFSGPSIPLFVTFFRINLMVSNPFSFFLLSAIYQIPFDPLNFATFLSMMALTSLASPGLPQTGNVYSLPVFLAAGVPLEGLVLLKALDAIPDLFKTLLNVTEISAIGFLSFKWFDKKATQTLKLETGEV